MQYYLEEKVGILDFTVNAFCMIFFVYTLHTCCKRPQRIDCKYKLITVTGGNHAFLRVQ